MTSETLFVELAANFAHFPLGHVPFSLIFRLQNTAVLLDFSITDPSIQ